jgi:ribulose-5-phosphate 4-epimerase/fuculose-1-phosphate aldolase
MERPDQLLDELATACRQLAAEGHEDGNWGHLAARDPSGRGFWLKRSGIGLGEVRSREDFILLDFDGEQLAGSGMRHLEWPIHAEIMRARTDVAATAHTHALSFALFSATDVELQQLLHESTAFVDRLPRFRATSDLIVTPELGRLLAQELGDARAVLMASHGAAVTGKNVADLAVNVICLTKAIDAQRAMAATGWPVIEPGRDEAVAKARRIWSLEMADVHWSFWIRRDSQAGKRGHHEFT